MRRASSKRTSPNIWCERVAISRYMRAWMRVWISHHRTNTSGDLEARRFTQHICTIKGKCPFKNIENTIKSCLTVRGHDSQQGMARKKTRFVVWRIYTQQLVRELFGRRPFNRRLLICFPKRERILQGSLRTERFWLCSSLVLDGKLTRNYSLDFSPIFCECRGEIYYRLEFVPP